MNKLFSKTSKKALSRVGLNILNALMLASILLSNINGVVPVDAKAEYVSHNLDAKIFNSSRNTNPQVEFGRPISRVVDQKKLGPTSQPSLSSNSLLLCVNGPCSGSPASPYLYEHYSGAGAVGVFGETLPTSINFIVVPSGYPCENQTGCNNTTVYYHSTLVQTFHSTFAERTLLVSNFGVSGTGGVTSILCGSGWDFTCTVEVWGVIKSQSVYSIHAEMQVGTFGTADWEAKDWTVEVSLDPSLISHLPDDAILCPSCNGSAINYVADPINTRTGGMSYPIMDIGIPTPAGQITFQRTYSSAATALYTNPLGYGWTHNHDMHLVFPLDIGGQQGFLKLKDFSGNYFRFWDVGNGTYVAYSGVPYSLVKQNTTPVTYMVKDSAQNVFILDANGYITKRTTTEGHEINYEYDINNRLHRISTSGGNQYIELLYNSQGQLYRVEDFTGRHVLYSYDGNGDLSTSTDLLGEIWTFTYENHRLVDVIDPDLNTKVHTDYYTSGDWAGRAWRQYNGTSDLVAELTYSANGSTTITNAIGNTMTDVYNPQGVVSQQTDLAGGGTDKVFDGNFRPSLIIDQLNNATHLSWDSSGYNLTRIENALHQITNVTYDELNNPISIVDPSGQQTKYFYEDPNFPTLPTKVESPLSFDGGLTYSGITYEYYQPNNADNQPSGKIKFSTDSLGNRTYYIYDTMGLITSITRMHGTPDSLTLSYIYDSRGNITDMTDEAGVVTHNEYNLAGQLTRTIQNYDPARSQNFGDVYNLTTEYRYDVRGNQIASIDTYGVITRTYFDLSDRPIVIVRNLTGQSIDDSIPPARNTSNTTENIRTDNHYDSIGNLIAVVDPSGVINRTYYDEANRPITTVNNLVGPGYADTVPPTYNPAFPDQNIRTDTVYDANGNAIASIDTHGIITRNYYDSLNRLSSIVQNFVGDIFDANPPGRGSGYQNIRTDLYYDANGNTIAMVDPSGVIARTYFDAMNRPTSVVQNLTGQAIGEATPPNRLPGITDENLRTDTYYDQTGNVIATVDPMGIVTRTYYDHANRPVTVVQNLIGNIYSANPPGSGTTDENVRTDISYDQNGRRNTTTDALGYVTKYEYNQLGQNIKIIVNYLDGAPQNSQTRYNLITEYDFDALGRVQTVTDTQGNRI